MKTLDILKGAAILVGAVVIIYFVIRLLMGILAIVLPIAVVGLLGYIAWKLWWPKKGKRTV